MPHISLHSKGFIYGRLKEASARRLISDSSESRSLISDSGQSYNQRHELPNSTHAPDAAYRGPQGARARDLD